MTRQHSRTIFVGLACALGMALLWLPCSHGELIGSPEEHDFGDVVLGESSTTYFTITSVERRHSLENHVAFVVHPATSFSSSFNGEFVYLRQSDPEELVDVDGTLFFIADDGEHGGELWKSDGTAGGTVMVKDLVPGPDAPFLSTLGGCGGMVYLRCYFDSTGYALCRSDGTEAGTGILENLEIAAAIVPSLQPFCAEGTLYLGADDGVSGRELWQSDGTEEGTYLVADIYPGGSSAPGFLTSVGGVLYFAATDGDHGRELWKSDGTAAGTVMVKDIVTGPNSSTPGHLTPFQGLLFFTADDSVHGRELWKSDGTPEGTVLVKDILPGDPPTYHNDYPRQLTVAGDTLFLIADDGVSGLELWKSDGTEAGTLQVADIFPGEEISSLYWLTDVDGVLYFSAFDPDRTSFRVLWKTDGTAAGTVIVKDVYVADPMAVIGSTLYFRGGDEATGYELWKSDGTEAGTVLVRDIDPDDSSYPRELTVSGGALYFVAYDPLYARELFRSDGSYLGTSMVHDIRPGGDPTFEVDVTFTPTAAGTVSGFLHVVGDANDVFVPLQGTGVAPGPTPEELIVEILTTFDAAVAEGTLVGSGPAGSAAGRLGALRNMLVTAQTLIDDGDVAAACIQLLDAYNRTDGEPIPPDFVAGDAAPVLAAMIEDLRDLLECD